MCTHTQRHNKVQHHVREAIREASHGKAFATVVQDRAVIFAYQVTPYDDVMYDDVVR